MAKRYTYIPNRVIDTDGIADGATIDVFLTGTTTPVSIFSDEALTTPLANPYTVAAGAAVPSIYHNTSGNIRVRVLDSGGATISDDDPYERPITDVELSSTTEGKGASLVSLEDGTNLQTFGEEKRDGSANLRARTASTAAALETLSASYKRLTGYSGDTHTVETAPYLTQDSLIIDGNGATLRNTNATSLATNDIVSATLPLGTANLSDEDNLTYYAVTSTAGNVMTVASANGSNFTAGDAFIMRGATSYTSGSAVYRNYLRGKVIASTATTITLDRVPSAELVADTPEIATLAEAIASGVTGIDTLYYLIAPRIHNLRLTSDVGEAWKWGGVIDGTFKDIEIVGRNGVVFNALQDCTFENIRFYSWRKGVEIADGSVGTVIRNVRGVLEDSATKNGGASDGGVFYVAINENCRDCVLDNIHINSGPNDEGTGVNACQIGSGIRNEIRNSTFTFPSHTGPALSIQSVATAGNACEDSGFVNCVFDAPNCNIFFNVSDGGSGQTRPYIKNCRFYGTPSTRGGNLAGTDGVFEGNYLESGAILLDSGMTGWSIRNNFIAGGFTANPSHALMEANDISDNDSTVNASLRADAVQVNAQQSITSTTSNNSYQSATFTAGELENRDRIFVNTIARTNGTAGNKNGRVTITVNGTEQAVATGLQGTTTGRPLGFEVELYINANTQIAYKARYFNDTTGVEEAEGLLTVADISANNVTVEVEYWVANGADSIVTQACRIIPVKPGMKHLPIK